MFLPISANLDVLDVNYQLLKKPVFSMVFYIFFSITTKILSNYPLQAPLSPLEEAALILMQIEQRTGAGYVHNE